MVHFYRFFSPRPKTEPVYFGPLKIGQDRTVVHVKFEKKSIFAGSIIKLTKGIILKTTFGPLHSYSYLSLLNCT